MFSEGPASSRRSLCVYRRRRFADGLRALRVCKCEGLLANIRSHSAKSAMLTNTQLKAVKLLFEFSNEKVARRLRIKPETLEEWQRDPEFAQAVRGHLRGNQQAAARILSRLYLEACRELEALIKSGDEKSKYKVIMEVILKTSGLLKELGPEENGYVGNLLDKLADQPEENRNGEEE